MKVNRRTFMKTASAVGFFKGFNVLARVTDKGAMIVVELPPDSPEDEFTLTICGPRSEGGGIAERTVVTRRRRSMKKRTVFSLDAAEVNEMSGKGDYGFSITRSDKVVIALGNIDIDDTGIIISGAGAATPSYHRAS